MPKKKTEEEMSEAEKQTRDEFNYLSYQWKEALKPINDEKVIVFPKDKIPYKDHPKWPACPNPRITIPIESLESMFAMYNWYLFLGRHLLEREVLELTNDVFHGMEITSERFIDNVKDPNGRCRTVCESLDKENRHHLELRCDRWFKSYLSRDPRARKRASYLLGFRGRLDNLRIGNLSLSNRQLECWEAFVHNGLIDTSKAKDRTGDFTSVLMHHYCPGDPNATISLARMTNRLQSRKDSVAQWLFGTYKKHEQFWMDKGQDMILEYDSEVQGRSPGGTIGNLEVPTDLRNLLDLKLSHITLNPADSGWLSEIFEQYQSSSQGQDTDSRIQHGYLQVPENHPDKLAPLRPDLGTASDIARSSTQVSARNVFQRNDPYPFSQYHQERQNIPLDQSLRAGYQRSYQAPPLDDPIFPVTTDMGNLSMAAIAHGVGQHRTENEHDILAPRPEYEHDILASTDEAVGKEEIEEIKRKSGREGKKEHRSGEHRSKRKHHSDKHDKSETPPNEKQPRKRQSGQEARKRNERR